MKLDLNCEVEYIGSFLSQEESNGLLHELLKVKDLTTPFSMELASGELFQQNFGKMMFVDREIYDKKKLPSSIWGTNQVWSESMSVLKRRIEGYTGQSFATCVCIYYPDGNAGVDYHSDQVAFGDTNIIASISLGEERLFQLREKQTGKVYDLILGNGSLLVMGNGTQDRYEHALPINPTYKRPRINLTFRKFGFD
ncbi:alpha-ketoglutarate-dependent dioxygenase AlkB [Algoriphagus sediminis]|uniref:Alpha-ketoglutarate-dependent dioxygenase AlkB n=1 Tax=Algoriphagus sediminis TaxID=3057113 RepID=A0ABT7YBI6_9BACT|nr:alpha-ketoglutarate-dependent dioxygenase AlkB [Algoriphagus sediminis]MDN3203883.1 alpha-ketoglutarate-dependent dioxygenase AlkB [Algoriphagus sediminis]